MKTTLDISDNILKRAKVLAKTEHITLRALTEEGLKSVLEVHEKRKPYQVKPVTFAGRGLSPEFQNASWGQLRDEVYKARGS